MTEKEIIKDLGNIKPIDHGTIAKPHTPVYKMHRYFARRPYSVFSELIKHYSNPGSIILDPFCGGGVTIVEGLRLKRKVIGADINPMATFITRMEVMDVDLGELQKAFEEIEAKVKDEILELYMTKCPKCKKQTPAEWFEWSNVLSCPSCNTKFIVSEAKKTGAGTYTCPNCKKTTRQLSGERFEDEISRIRIRYNCGFKGDKKPTTIDKTKYETVLTYFKNSTKTRRIWFPKDKIEDLLKEWKPEKKRLQNRGLEYFYELFTPRNLLSLSLLYKTISQIRKNANKEILFLAFSNTLSWACKMCYVQRQINSWARHAYNLRDKPLEMNVWKAFDERYQWIKNGEKHSQKEIGDYFKEADGFKQLVISEKTCWLVTKSSHKLPLPDDSIDAVITDPPYGSNVNYLHLSSFWIIWLRDILGITETSNIDFASEVIENRFAGKDIKTYRYLMYGVLQECYRVLKPNKWMVMTFHNKNFGIWNAIHLAAHDAGFLLSEEDGMIYQPAIHQYETTAHQKEAGSVLGDFILSFKKAEKPPQRKIIDYLEIEKKIQELAAEAVLHHGGRTGGVSLSTVYLKLIPFLLNNNLLEKIGEKDLPSYLRDSFIERNGKWYLKENIGDPLRVYLSDYSKMHYKEDYGVLDFVPVEARLDYLIRRLLYKQGYATQDEILNEIYSNLINSNAAEYGEINRVLNRIAKLVPGPKDKRKVWRLREDIERQEKLDLIEEKVKEIVEVSEESEHDLVIRRLVELGAKEGYASHIGRTEQKKYVEFRKLSLPMANNVQYGMDKKGFEIVTEIDVLWLKGDTIVSAFEVEKTTTIDSGINRFRNLFAVQPNTTIETYIVIPNKRKKEAEKKLSSPANVKNGLTQKIGYILFDDLDIKGNVEKIDFSKIKRKVE
jgi:SAM-dependent methyltransferase